jgi:hypothetical protein
MKMRIVLAVFALSLLTAATPAWAGRISINSGLIPKPAGEDGKPLFDVWVQNDGDEAAKKVQVHLTFDGTEMAGPLWEDLQPGQRKMTDFRFENVPTRQGTYPIYLTIDFADLNLYPFTAQKVEALTVGSAPKATIFAKSQPVSVKKSGKMPVTVKNESNADKAVTAKVFGPRELTIRPNALDLTLPATGEKELSFDVENFSALPGAAYPIWLVFEYETADIHYTQALVTMVSVAAGGMTPGARDALIGGAAGVLLVIVVFEIVRRTRGRKKA